MILASADVTKCKKQYFRYKLYMCGPETYVIGLIQYMRAGAGGYNTNRLQGGDPTFSVRSTSHLHPDVCDNHASY